LNFLNKFVLKIVPCLNPDGCIRGHWRVDTQGVNLNRVYKRPNPIYHPTIYAVKQAIAHENNKGTLTIYTDFHAHVQKRSCFVFGNDFMTKERMDPEKHIEQLLLPKLLGLNCVNFDARECSYRDDDTNKKNA
jgi:cytosolic carboxypeptidase protein 5